jgi:hypothetical protein
MLDQEMVRLSGKKERGRRYGDLWGKPEKLFLIEGGQSCRSGVQLI